MTSVFYITLLGKVIFSFIAASSPNNFNEETVEFSLVLELHTHFQI